MLTGLCSLFYIFMLFAGLFGAVTVVTEYKPNAGGCAFFFCILFGILVCLTVGLAFTPLVDWTQNRYGAEKALLIVFIAIALLLLPPSWLFLGRVGPPNQDEPKKDELKKAT